MYTSSVLVGSVLALVANSNAHMIMNTPTPYGLKDLQVVPLNGQGYNFPCQSGSRTDAFDATGVYNPMVVGQDNLLNFTGSAVHGGGSCQLSVTYDYPPPADKSKWKVIHSYVGSCPSNSIGNIDTLNATDAQGRAQGKPCTSADQTECVKQYNFQIPEGMKNGNATLAWTWFNKVGSREMYMNCAPISISGGSDDDTFFNTLPDMFVANIPGECTTGTEEVLGFPEPGKFVTFGEEAFSPDASGTCPAAGPGNSPSGSGSASGSASSSAAQTYSASSSSTASSVSAVVPTSYAPAPTSESTTTIVSTTMATFVGTAPVPSGTGYIGSSSGNSTSGACSSSKIPCPSPGDLVCIDDSHFGICDVDFCATPRKVAPGTTCSNNIVSKRDVIRRRNSRIHRHIPGHVHQHDF